MELEAQFSSFQGLDLRHTTFLLTSVSRLDREGKLSYMLKTQCLRKGVRSQKSHVLSGMVVDI